MTELKKRVRREFNSKLWKRSVIVEIDPAGYIILREKHSRHRYPISIEALYYLLCRKANERKSK